MKRSVRAGAMNAPNLSIVLIAGISEDTIATAEADIFADTPPLGREELVGR